MKKYHTLQCRVRVHVMALLRYLATWNLYGNHEQHDELSPALPLESDLGNEHPVQSSSFLSFNWKINGYCFINNVEATL
jgi:hypothetical protein